MNAIRFFLFLLATSSSSFANEVILKSFEAQMLKSDASFKSFSTAAGEKLFRNERINSENEKISCMTCHTSNPKGEGLTRSNKVIEALVPVVNKERFNDMANEIPVKAKKI